MAQHPFDMFEHVPRANPQQLTLAPFAKVGLVGPFIQCVDPFGDGAALVFAGVFQLMQPVM